MRIIGFSTGVTGSASNVGRMVKDITTKTGYGAGFIDLTDIETTAKKMIDIAIVSP